MSQRIGVSIPENRAVENRASQNHFLNARLPVLQICLCSKNMPPLPRARDDKVLYGLGKSAVASDAVTVLKNPKNFASLRLFRQGRGSFCPSARSEALENCQLTAHTSPARITSRSAPACSGRALMQAQHSPAISSSATTAAHISRS